jgi:DNA polymerase-3 subunit epsilon
MPAFEPLTDLIPQALPELCSWADRPRPEDFGPLPGTPAVLLFVDVAGRPVQLLTTQHLKRIVTARLTAPDEPHRGKADLAEIVRGVRWRAVGCPFEARWWYYRLASALHPRDYRDMIGFGPAWFLHVDWAQAIPEIRVSERVWMLPGQFVGPWPSHRECQAALEGLWDLFDLCRYPEQVRRAPQGTRCAYAEMGRCDAPCDGTVPLDAYIARTRAAWGFACGEAEAWTATAVQRMQLAAAEQRYELAAQFKQQLAFAQHWQQEWGPRVRPLARLNWLIGLPVTRRRAWKLFLFRAGEIVDGPVMLERKLPAEGLAWLQQAGAAPPAALPDVTRMEQTWLVCHLVFSREADRALLHMLGTGESPAELGQQIAERIGAVRARSGDDDARTWGDVSSSS